MLSIFHALNCHVHVVFGEVSFHTLNITDSTQLAGLPEYVKTMGAETAAEKGLEGWAFTLDYPSFGPFMKYSTVRDLRKDMWLAYNTRATEGENAVYSTSNHHQLFRISTASR